MDAFTHCVETYLSPLVNPPADAIALDGVARAWKWIDMCGYGRKKPGCPLEYDDGRS